MFYRDRRKRRSTAEDPEHSVATAEAEGRRPVQGRVKRPLRRRRLYGIRRSVIFAAVPSVTPPSSPDTSVCRTFIRFRTMILCSKESD